jgi:hypothetical protein
MKDQNEIRDLFNLLGNAGMDVEAGTVNNEPVIDFSFDGRLAVRFWLDENSEPVRYFIFPTL